MTDVRRLPPLREGDWEWQLRAACRGKDTTTFYHPENERGLGTKPLVDDEGRVRMPA